MLVWIGDAAVAPSPAPVPPPPPLAYTPSYLAEKILTSRSALEGERKQVTVLFADLKGSMELLADRDPEEAQQLLDPVLEHMMAAVHRYEGTVNQVLGDGIMALFGAPAGPRGSCGAGLLRRPGDAGRPAPLCRGGAPRPRSGAADARRAQLRRSGGAGDRQRPAHGLLGRGPDDASGGAHGAAGHAGQYPADGRDPAARRGAGAGHRPGAGSCQGTRGAGGGLRAGRGQRRPPAFAGRRARGLTRFVGRQHGAGGACSRRWRGPGRGRARWWRCGRGGVGKSRLVYEFVHSHHTRAGCVLESASVSYGKATPYFPVIDLLKRYGHVEDSDDTRTIRAKVTGQVLTLDETLQDTLPALLALLDALPEDSPS